MKKILLFVGLAATVLSVQSKAGTLKVATYPAVHPIKTTVTVAKVATYPVRHPVKSVKAVSPVQPRW